MKTFIPLLSLLFLALVGCSTPSQKMTGLKVGMTREEAIAVMGKPDTLSAQGSSEQLIYRPPLGEIAGYYVRLVNGRVESFGQDRFGGFK